MRDRKQTLESQIARWFGMSDEVWRGHANPWSVWTRVPILPLFALAVWSRVWIGWWSLLPVLIIACWTWLNPRVFPPPRSTNSWASKGVHGERFWLNRKNEPVPEHHLVVPNLLILASAAGSGFLVWGLVFLEIWPTLFGLLLAVLGKLWFVDRMAWLYVDMRAQGYEPGGGFSLDKSADNDETVPEKNNFA